LPSRPDIREASTACATDTGRVRATNQDEVGEFSDATGARLLVVADGMGGHAGGEVASRVCVECMAEIFQAESEDPEPLLKRLFLEANERVYRMGNETPGLFGMGTTAVALLLDPRHPGSAWVAHVGDSRAYRLRAGTLDQLTDDHSWVYEEVRNHRLTPEEAEVHPRRNALLRSIGIDADVDADVRRVDVAAGDRFLLCSDGLWGELPATTIADVLGRQQPAPAARELVDRANEAGGHDNITAALLTLPDPDRKPTRRTPRKSPGRRRLILLLAAAAALALLYALL